MPKAARRLMRDGIVSDVVRIVTGELLEEIGSLMDLGTGLVYQQYFNGARTNT